MVHIDAWSGSSRLITSYCQADYSNVMRENTMLVPSEFIKIQSFWLVAVRKGRSQPLHQIDCVSVHRLDNSPIERHRILAASEIIIFDNLNIRARNKIACISPA